MSISFVCAEEAVQGETPAEETAAVQQPDVLLHDDSENRSPHEAGIYFKDYFPVARMHNHSFNFIGGGFSYAYHSPWNIPVTAKLQNVFGNSMNIGFTGRADFVSVYTQQYVYKWYTFNFFAGAFLQWKLNEWLEVQPSLEYGLQFDNVYSSRTANGLYVNQAIQLSASFRIKPKSILKDGLAFELAPLYTMSFEPDGIANYLGLRFGLNYRIGGKKYYESSEQQIQVVEKIVEKEVIKEVPVETIVEKEVIREVPVEKIVEKEVIKEVPVEVIKYVEKTEDESETNIIEANETESFDEETSEENDFVSEEVEDSLTEEEPEVTEEDSEIPEEVTETAVEEETPVIVESVTLSMNEDGSLKIDIPNLNFVSDKALLTDAASNKETINQVFEILNEEIYKEFKCIITGYVNPDGAEWSEDEKLLAYERAEAVKNELVELGVSEDRFTVQCGSGKTDNKEYNRRVEFKLVK